MLDKAESEVLLTGESFELKAVRHLIKLKIIPRITMGAIISPPRSTYPFGRKELKLICGGWGVARSPVFSRLGF